ncbi:MAG: Uma2 family endonuclease [Candidatus Aminicenantes bacterium]|nr:Uma2 family endonuclease [Candidatus Aminicenantes bacterium]
MYADYLTWPEGERWELIEGVPFDMTPAPSRYHQEISINLSVVIKNFLKDKECMIYAAPFDVRLPEGRQENDETQTVVQPDISVICDPEKLDDRGCVGAPDFIVEIVSPNTVKKDMKDKLLLYEKHGVPEYWVVHPAEHMVLVYKLDEQGRYGREEVYTKEDEIELVLNENPLTINLEEVF